MAEADFDTVHAGMRYDFEVSSEADLDGNVDRLLSAWRGRSGPTIFAQLAGQG
jgi:hypothetical protein